MVTLYSDSSKGWDGHDASISCSWRAAFDSSILVLFKGLVVSDFSITSIWCYYQYAWPNDQLPSVKRAISRVKRDMRGLKIHLSP